MPRVVHNLKLGLFLAQNFVNLPFVNGSLTLVAAQPPFSSKFRTAKKGKGKSPVNEVGAARGTLLDNAIQNV